jgi:hypothetical protein
MGAEGRWHLQYSKLGVEPYIRGSMSMTDSEPDTPSCAVRASCGQRVDRLAFLPQVLGAYQIKLGVSVFF